MNEPKIRYRLATPDDQTFLNDMNVAASYGATRDASNYPPTADVMQDPDIAMFSERFGRPGDTGLIAENEYGRRVGAIWGREYAREPGDPLEGLPFELTIAVDQEVRGKGIGRQLLDTFATMAWLQGWDEISLAVHQKSPARKLYEAAGYVAVVKPDGSEARVDDKFVPMTRPTQRTS